MDASADGPRVMSTDDRAEVFARIRTALARRGDRTPRPEIDHARLIATRRLAGVDLWEAFARNLAAVRGSFCRSLAELVDLLKQHDVKRGYCDPALRNAVGDPLRAHFAIVDAFPREQIDAIDFGVTAAGGVIAETGTIILRDRATSNRLAALAPWVHVAVVRADTIHRTVTEAIEAFDDDPNTIFVTGPSKTADVEGILIEGVHGPGVQAALRLD
jgi:L-lactate dehydrogenase complex protein LldG